MQNEITELRNQVRTLKRIVCLVCCLFVVFVYVGCSSRGANMNRGGTYSSDNSDGSVSLLGGLIRTLGKADEEDAQPAIPRPGDPIPTTPPPPPPTPPTPPLPPPPPTL